MNKFSYLEGKVCGGRGLMPHCILRVDKLDNDLYAIKAYTYSAFGQHISKFQATKNRKQMENFELSDEREYQLFIKRVFEE